LRFSQFHSFLPSEHDTLLIARPTVNGFIASDPISGVLQAEKPFCTTFFAALRNIIGSCAIMSAAMFGAMA
jgi:hypothetical protein